MSLTETQSLKQLHQKIKVSCILNHRSQMNRFDQAPLRVSVVTNPYLIRYNASCRGTKNLYP